MLKDSDSVVQCGQAALKVTIQFSSAGTSSVGSFAFATGSAMDHSRLRDEFERDNCILLEGFLDRQLLNRIRHDLEEADFSVRVDDGICTELQAKHSKVPALLNFLTQDPELFELVRYITGCRRIGRFKGRLFQVTPGPDQEDSWHTDLHPRRMVAMSINLSTGPYSGGVLEIRQEGAHKLVHRATNPMPGDAVLFRIAQGLSHRITGVKGKTARTAWAGWFLSGADSPLLSPKCPDPV